MSIRKYLKKYISMEYIKKDILFATSKVRWLLAMIIYQNSWLVNLIQSEWGQYSASIWVS